MTLLAPQAAGYAGSERSGCVLTVYTKAKQGLSFYSQGLGAGLSAAYTFDGQDAGILIGAGTSNGLGGGGQWQAQVKAEPGVDLLSLIEADSWVDISFVRFGVAWHVMRGLVTDIRVQEAAAGAGVTVRTCTLAGQSFQRVWQTTLWWFSAIQQENLGNSSVIKSIGVDRLIRNPSLNVSDILFNFFRVIAATGRSNYALPASMPNAKGSIADVVAYDDSGFNPDKDARYSPTASSIFPNVDLWSMSTEYQDGMFCECWTDILPSGGLDVYALDPVNANGLSPSQSQMTVVFRDRPFLRADGSGGYFKLPTHEVRRADVPAIDTGIASQEIFNSFSYSALASQDAVKSMIDLQYCLWNVTDMSRRGMRKLEASSMYYSPNIVALYKSMRAKLRDWYCLGDQLLQGSVSLARGFPEIRVGSRIAINGPQPDDRLTFYVESVRHMWSAGGMRTSLDVTRGYRGTDASHLANLQARVLDYSQST